MRQTLTPKKIAGTTRFTFELQLTSTMMFQVIKEFAKEYDVMEKTAQSIKLLHSNEGKALEVAKQYISFFPSLTENETEDVRKRIYKHIAKRSEVYFSTSEENLELSISSLLSDDLRSCASLLYYSLHKYLNSSMHNFFNNELKLEDHQIEIAEIEHFTSANFHLFISNYNEQREILNTENYVQLLRNEKRKYIDPFILSEYLFRFEKDESFFTTLELYVSYLCKTLFGINYKDSECGKSLQILIDDFQQRKSGKEHVTQEVEVQVAIAYAILQQIKGSRKSLWLFHALVLRLYWLRQTADYDFDFEVKTSVREISVLVSLISSLTKQQLIFGSDSTFESDLKGEDDVAKNSYLQYENKKLVTEKGSNADIMCYSVDISFPKDINANEEVDLFLIAIHLNAEFKKDNIINAINLTKNTVNRGKYFIYESQRTFKPEINIHIDNDGRWTAWSIKNNRFKTILNPQELLNVFEEFLSELTSSLKKYFHIVYEPILLTSFPKYIENLQDRIGTKSLVNTDKINLARRQFLERRVTDKIGSRLKVGIKRNYFIIEDLEMHINLHLNLVNPMDVIPMKNIVLNQLLKETNQLVIINIIIGGESKEEKEELNDLISKSNTVLYHMKEENLFGDCISEVYNIQLTFSYLDKFLNGQNEDYIMKEVAACINGIAYNRIIDNKLSGTDKIIELCESIPNAGSFPVATMGLWYLRNDDISLEASEEQGKMYYEKAIRLENNEEDNKLEDLKQKYNLELARFYFYRRNDNEQAYYSISKALEYGEQSFFYEESLKMSKLILKELEHSAKASSEVAATIEN